MHAYRDEARAARRALELWPDGEREAERIALLERYARCAELAGDLSEAMRALARGGGGSPRRAASGRALADAQRHLAAVYELQGDRERALAARRVAADSFAANGLPGEAAARAARRRRVPAERGQARRGGRAGARRRGRGAARRAQPTSAPARWASRAWRRPRAATLRPAWRPCRAGLSLALGARAHGARRPSSTSGSARRCETSGDYGGAHEALDHRGRAVPHRRRRRARARLPVVRGLRAARARRLGQLGRALPTSSRAGDGRTTTRSSSTGSSARSTPSAASPPARGRCSLRSLDTASRLDVVSMQLDTAASLACAGGADGRSRRGRRALPLRARALGAQRGPPLRRLGPALGGVLPRRRRARRRGARLRRRAGAHRGPYRPSRRARRARPRAGRDGAAGRRRRDARPSSSGARSTCRPRSTSPSSARRSSCAPASSSPPRANASPRSSGWPAPTGRPAASARGRWPCARPRRSARLGESVERRLGRRAAAAHDGAGLSRREVEVMRLLAVGRTNREIARELVPQPAHGRRPRAQHLLQARLPLARRGDGARRRARAARLAPAARTAPPSAGERGCARPCITGPQSAMLQVYKRTTVRIAIKAGSI